MTKAGAGAGETVMIGDTVHDMRMAKAGGVAAIGVAWGYHDAVDLTAAGADIVIERFDELDARDRQAAGSSACVSFSKTPTQHRDDGYGRAQAHVQAATAEAVLQGRRRRARSMAALP